MTIEYEVTVGNIGSVYLGLSRREAERTYNIYVDQSQSGVGRAGNEIVTLIADMDIIVKEYLPPGMEENI